MAFVPVFVPPAQASARAKDLARRLEETIATFERQYPGTSPEDIRHAVHIATGGAGRPTRPPRVVMALVAGLIAMGIGLFVTLAQRGGTPGGEGAPPIPWVILGLLAGLLGVVVAIRRRG